MMLKVRPEARLGGMPKRVVKGSQFRHDVAATGAAANSPRQCPLARRGISPDGDSHSGNHVPT